ncbi:SIR2 family NAD-dependent protein deacylase [Microvirga massiliensis]|uniref:SIR2 family NAD-dependent protein deacylase n=1 Tax=Microvirga massiliensis TaxID=1033741 RepID=UPI00062B5B25|nr:Sir2 family NAD-dependent protein deacetylase [Microvirga massiliensis]
MIRYSGSNGIAQLEEFLGMSRSVVGFTGAGISTESGIPDFRSPDSPWKRGTPIPFDLFLRSEEARREAWRRKFALDDLYRGAKPNRGHAALSTLVAGGRMSAIITQNIDGLHQASGVKPEKVIELHGNGTYAICLSCELRHDLARVRMLFEETGAAPRCAACGGIVKSGTISFGQALPESAMRRARERTEACDLFLAVGSSLVVYPAAAFPALAKHRGVRLVILNREPTELDSIADLVIHGEIGDVLSFILERRGPMPKSSIE